MKLTTTINGATKFWLVAALVSTNLFFGCQEPIDYSGSNLPGVPMMNYTIDVKIVSSVDSSIVEKAIVWIENPYSNEVYAWGASNQLGLLELSLSLPVATGKPIFDSSLILRISKEGYVPQNLTLSLLKDTADSSITEKQAIAIVPMKKDTVSPFVITSYEESSSGKSTEIIVFSKSMDFVNYLSNSIISYSRKAYPCDLSDGQVYIESSSSGLGSSFTWKSYDNILRISHDLTFSTECLDSTYGQYGREVYSYTTTTVNWNLSDIDISGFSDIIGNPMTPYHWPN